MEKVILKLCTVMVRIRYPRMKYEHRYFIRDNYYSRLFQLKFLFKDYFFKKRYKIIDYKGEFQIELTHVLPFAYWHFLNGTLLKTISCKHTNELYFFSPHHEERYEERDYKFNYSFYGFPNMTHSITKSYKKWAEVPLKDHYKNNVFVYEKPILIIANKYNTEWSGSPVNFISVPVLEKIISNYKDKYQIIYNRPSNSHIVGDNSDILDLNEFEWIKKTYPEVIFINELFDKHKNGLVKNFNHLQLMVYANSSHFVSVHGGGSALASYFGGINIVLSTGWMEATFNEYSSYWPKFSGAKILHAKNEEQVFQYLQKYY